MLANINNARGHKCACEHANLKNVFCIQNIRRKAAMRCGGNAFDSRSGRQRNLLSRVAKFQDRVLGYAHVSSRERKDGL